jgi:hypothetical protein
MLRHARAVCPSCRPTPRTCRSQTTLCPPSSR